MASVPAFFAQLAFRWYNDDGTEATQTAAAAQDTNISAPLDSIRCLRYEVEDQANGDSDVGFTLQVSYKGGAYGDVSASTAWIGANSSNLTSDTDTTQRIGTSAKTFDTDNDGVQEDHTMGDKGPYNNLCWEHLWVGKANAAYAGIAVGDTIDFRERSSAAVLDSYTNYPRLTVSASGPPKGSLSMMGVGR